MIVRISVHADYHVGKKYGFFAFCVSSAAGNIRLCAPVKGVSTLCHVQIEGIVRAFLLISQRKWRTIAKIVVISDQPIDIHAAGVMQFVNYRNALRKIEKDTPFTVPILFECTEDTFLQWCRTTTQKAISNYH